jgi:mono/diheme cytochrome c family protein
MKRVALITAVAILSLELGCSNRHATTSALHATAAGSALVESSGGKQFGFTGSTLGQPLAVQVNDKQGNAVTGAIVSFTGPAGVAFDPPQVLTDSSGQASTQVTLGSIAGRYDLTATSADSGGKTFIVNVAEYAAGYQQQLGHQIEETYCVRCHDSESSAQRVSNYNNLEVKPHPFSEGDVLNKMSDTDIMAVISHGGQSMNMSGLMPPYGATLTRHEMQALIAYIRLVSDPPYKPAGLVYAKR